MRCRRPAPEWIRPSIESTAEFGANQHPRPPQASQDRLSFGEMIHKLHRARCPPIGRKSDIVQANFRPMTADPDNTGRAGFPAEEDGENRAGPPIEATGQDASRHGPLKKRPRAFLFRLRRTCFAAHPRCVPPRSGRARGVFRPGSVDHAPYSPTTTCSSCERNTKGDSAPCPTNVAKASSCTGSRRPKQTDGFNRSTPGHRQAC